MRLCDIQTTVNNSNNNDATISKAPSITCHKSVQGRFTRSMT